MNKEEVASVFTKLSIRDSKYELILSFEIPESEFFFIRSIFLVHVRQLC